MRHYLSIAVATPATMTADAYREFCWGAGLPETTTGYGLIIGHTDIGDTITEVLDDVDYVRLLMQASGPVTIPADKIRCTLHEWPQLDPGADSVWD